MTNTNNGDAAKNSCAQRVECKSEKISAAEKPTGDLPEKVRAAMIRAYDLGQKYWMQADSEYESEHKKADVTAGRFIELNDELCAAIATYLARQSQAAQPSIDDKHLRQLVLNVSNFAFFCGRTDDDDPTYADKIEAAQKADEALISYVLAGQSQATKAQGEPVAYVNGDELDNMLDDRTATIQGNASGWRKTPLYAAPVAKEVQAVPAIGKLLDEFSALPVLWGLNEPGALVRHSDVFKMLVAAGKTYLAPTAQEVTQQAAKAAIKEDERDLIGAEMKRLHDALCFWLPQNHGDLPPAMIERIAADAYLLVGYDDMPDSKSAEELGWIRAAKAETAERAEPECGKCNDSGIIGFPPDQYESCPDCTDPVSQGGTSEQQARFAIDGAIQYGRENRNAPPSTDHWLYEYWNIGRQLAKLSETGWDNVTPLAPTTSTVSAPDVEYVPIAVDSNDEAGGRHPNDTTPADPECQKALDARGDDSGQGLDPYWKWGFRAGWHDHKRIAAPSSAEGVQATPQDVRNQAIQEVAELVDAHGEPGLARAIRALRTACTDQADTDTGSAE